MKRDDDPVPQFTSANRRSRLNRKARGGLKWDWLDAVSAVDLSGLPELLVKFVVGLFEHHH